MEKEGKVDILSVLIASIVIFVVYAVFAGGVVPLEFPANNTNASSSFGIGGTNFINSAAFNGTNASFQCNITTQNATTLNITRIVLFINKSVAPTQVLDNNTAVINQTLNLTNLVSSTTHVPFIFNLTDQFDEGRYAWMCQQEDNATVKTINQSGTNYFIIDNTPPGFTNLTNTTNSVVSTSDTIFISANFTDALTTIHTVRLFANISGTANNEINITVGNGIEPANNTLVNLSFKIPGNLTGHVLNFTLQANDSVNNINITTAIIITVAGDGTPPGPINLSNPIDNFNTTATSLVFNISAFDNNDTQFQCDINISLGGAIFQSIAGLNVTRGVHHLNSSTTALVNGTYKWSVNCTDGPGNVNMSTTPFTFTVDQIPPRQLFFNITTNLSSSFADASSGSVGSSDPTSVPATGSGTLAQGIEIRLFANWTDNLTRPSEADLQFYNISTASWVTLNTTLGVNTTNMTIVATNANASVNFTFTIPTGHNIFEGRNISFRIIANDTVGNVNSSMFVRNITVNINDTTKPTLSVSSVAGQVHVNGTNTSDTTPTVVWNVTENSQLRYIAVQIDGSTSQTCNKFANYTITDGLAESNRNGSITVSGSGTCPLAAGTRVVRLTVEDTWGNNELYIHSFEVETGTPQITLSNLQNGKSNVNNSNVTSSTGLNFTATNGATGKMKTFSWTSSCNTSTQTIASTSSEFPDANLTFIYPFQNISSCTSASENRTVTITVTDDAGNSNTSLFQFLVDNVAPSIAVHSPTDGQTFTDTNTTLNFSVLDDDQPISHVGYYLDGNDGQLFTLNISAAIGREGLNKTITNSTNFTVGTHTIKFTVNDTMGNIRNSSVITFTQVGTVNFGDKRLNLEEYSSNVFGANTFINSTINIKIDGVYQAVIDSNNTANTFEVLYQAANASINITITEINGSAANWDKINVTPYVNQTSFLSNILTNWTNKIINSTWFNNSLIEFLPDNNSYYGVVELPLNISGNTSTAQEFWWIPSEDADFSSSSVRVNISQCTGGFSRTDTTPCWNYTKNGRTKIFVPHFSIVMAVNDSNAPTINVTTPSANNQTVSSFVPNITVSSDAISCNYVMNTSTANRTMTKSGNICLGPLESFKNFGSGSATRGYNINFTVTDSSGNKNTYEWLFNVSDSTKSNNPNSSRISVSESTTSATITLSGFNETVNANVSYGTVYGTLTSTSLETDFNQTQAVALSSLSESTTYYFNVTVCDFNNNCARNGTFNFTTSAAAAAAAAAAASSGGGGGGGAAAPSDVADSRAQVWSSVPAGSSFSLDVDKADIAVTSVSVNDVKIDLSNVELEVAALTKNPVSEEAASKVYQYLRITKKNLNNEDAASFKVAFRVTKSWLSDNGLASGDISLYRFADSKWNELTTRVTGADSIYVNYEADTPGLSSFAIGVKSGVVAAEEAPEAEEVPTEAPEAEEVPTPVERPTPVQAPSKAPIAWIIAAVVVILGIILIVMYQKKKQQG